ncbi:MAG TPA: proteasome subunit alpha, partial [Actinomycetota bacterium]
RGYSYGREDVTAKTVANAYAQALNNIFTTQMKPYEVEILVGQIGDSPAENELFHILYDGSVTDEKGCVAMGGRSEDLAGHLRDDYKEGLSLEDSVRLATTAMSKVEENSAEAENLEAAVLDRSRGRRKFRRLTDQELARILQT